MRLLLTTDTLEGTWTYAIELARALASQDVEVVLAATGPAIRDPQRAQARALPNVQLELRPGSLEWMKEPWRDVDATGSWLLALAERHEPDIVQLGSYTHATLPFVVPKIVVAHSCVMSWYQAVRGAPAPREFDEYRRRVRAGLAAANMVVTPTWATMGMLAEHHGPQRRSRVIAHGLRAEAFPVGEKEPLVLCGGRLWDDAENTDALARVAPSLPWPVYFAGELAHPEGHERQLEGGTALGWLDEVERARWLARAAIWASPARYEPFGLATLEAAMAGCALVLGDTATHRELWHGAAELVPADDERPLIAAVRALVSSPELRQRRAHMARVRGARLTAARMATRYRALYDELLERADPVVRTPTPQPSLGG